MPKKQRNRDKNRTKKYQTDEDKQIQKETLDISQEVLDEIEVNEDCKLCLLYTSPSPRDATLSRMPSSA